MGARLPRAGAPPTSVGSREPLGMCALVICHVGQETARLRKAVVQPRERALRFFAEVPSDFRWFGWSRRAVPVPEPALRHPCRHPGAEALGTRRPLAQVPVLLRLDVSKLVSYLLSGPESRGSSSSACPRSPASPSRSLPPARFPLPGSGLAVCEQERGRDLGDGSVRTWVLRRVAGPSRHLPSHIPPAAVVMRHK